MAKKHARKASRKSTKSSRGRTTATFTKKVLDVVRSTREIKEVGTSGELQVSRDISGINNNVLGLLDFFPKISQGTKDTERLGDEITLRKIKLNFWIQYGTGNSTFYYNTDLNQQNVRARIMLLAQKGADNTNTLFQSNGVAYESMFENIGNAAYPGQFEYSNKFVNIQAPVNTDAFTKRMDIKTTLRQNVNDWTNPLGAQESDVVLPPPGNFKTFQKTMRFGKKGKKIRYSKATATYPEVWPYFLAAGYANSNGTNAVANNAKIFWTATIQYTDS